MYSRTETIEIGLRLKTEFALDIFTDLLGIVPKNNKKYRLLDTSPTTQDTFYLNPNSIPLIHNFSSGEDFNAIDAYKEKYHLSFKDAFIALCNKYINNTTTTNTPNRTYTPAIPTQVAQGTQVVPANPLEIAIKDFEDSISTRRKSNFVSFLRKTFGDAIVKQVLEMYDVGNTSYKGYDTAFWYRDANNKLLNAKYFVYDKENAKRSKTVAPNWLHYQKGKDNPKIGFFGEHLGINDNQTIWIVESEKSAIIATIYFLLNNVTDIVVWACGGLGSLKNAFENCAISKQALQKREFILVPDTDTTQTSFSNWNENEYVKQLASEGYNVSVSEYLEENCTDIQKELKFDIADLFISEYLETKETATPAIVAPATNEIVAQLSYESYSDLFANFDRTLNFGPKVEVLIFEKNPIDVEKLTIFFNSFDFGKSVNFNIVRILRHQPAFTTTLQANGEMMQIATKIEGICPF